MASNGLLKRAVKGTCRICQRVRNTSNQVKAVGEVHHGFATGHVWECIDIEDCEKVARNKLKECSQETLKHRRIKNALERGRYAQ